MFFKILKLISILLWRMGGRPWCIAPHWWRLWGRYCPSGQSEPEVGGQEPGERTNLTSSSSSKHWETYIAKYKIFVTPYWWQEYQEEKVKILQNLQTSPQGRERNKKFNYILEENSPDQITRSPWEYRGSQTAPSWASSDENISKQIFVWMLEHTTCFLQDRSSPP